MHIAAEIVALVVTVLVVSAVARRLDWSAPLCLIVVGVGASYVPGVPEYHLDPEVVLLGLLPPLLYSAAIQTSLVDFRKNRGRDRADVGRAGRVHRRSASGWSPGP